MNFLFDLIASVYQPWEPSKEVSYIGDHIVINIPAWIKDLEVTRTEDHPEWITLEAQEHWGEVTGAKYRKDIQIPAEWNNDYHIATNTADHVVILYPAWITKLGGENDGDPGNT